MIIREEIIGDCRLILGDCLEVLPTLAAGSVDAVVTDPPYMIGAISVGNSNAKSGTWADMENSAWWFAEWMKKCRAVLKDTGHFATCGNWRSVPTLICALARCEWAATSCLIWDKNWIGPAYENALRPTYELVMHAAMPNGKIVNRSASDIFRCQWMAGNSKTTEHAAEKPVGLMQHLTDLLTGHSGTVADPFMGSGTTGVACIRTGRKFIGIEKDPKYFDVSVKRIKAEYERSALFEGVESYAQPDMLAAVET